MNDDLEVAHPQSGSSSTLFLVELEFGNVGFCREGKTGVPGEECLILFIRKNIDQKSTCYGNYHTPKDYMTTKRNSENIIQKVL